MEPQKNPKQTQPPPQTKAITPVQAFMGTLQSMESDFTSILPEHVSAKKFIRVVQTAIQLKPELLSADRRKLFGELMKCAQDGLVPDGREAAIIPYAGDPKYIPMIGGICKKARNSGLIKAIDSVVVYENDHYEAWTDETGPHFKHMRAKGDRGKVVLTMAYAITSDGGFFLEEIDEQQMAKIEACCRAKNTPWKGSFKDEMRRKSAIRRLSKYRLPSSADIEDVIRRDDDLYDLGGKENTDKPAPTKDTPNRLKNIIDADAVTDASPPKAEDPPAETIDDPPEEEPPI